MHVPLLSLRMLFSSQYRHTAASYSSFTTNTFLMSVPEYLNTKHLRHHMTLHSINNRWKRQVCAHAVPVIGVSRVDGKIVAGVLFDVGIGGVGSLVLQAARDDEVVVGNDEALVDDDELLASVDARHLAVHDVDPRPQRHRRRVFALVTLAVAAHHTAQLVGRKFVGKTVRRHERDVVEAQVRTEGDRFEECDASV